MNEQSLTKYWKCSPMTLSKRFMLKFIFLMSGLGRVRVHFGRFFSLTLIVFPEHLMTGNTQAI